MAVEKVAQLISVYGGDEIERLVTNNETYSDMFGSIDNASSRDVWDRYRFREIGPIGELEAYLRTLPIIDPRKILKECELTDEDIEFLLFTHIPQ